jgi:AMP nucleosidase
VALQQAVVNVTGLAGHEVKTRMRTGTVATTANRNWELRYDELFERLNQSRAIAVDMESATIAANGFRFRVPYGTLLCVSDKPLHGELKLKGMATQFYRERINQHLAIGLEAIRILREGGPERLHSRKLRSFDEPAFR